MLLFSFWENGAGDEGYYSRRSRAYRVSWTGALS
jgi:hypothetical protein